MHEKRDTLISVAVGVGLLWIFLAWIVAPAVSWTPPGGLDAHRYASASVTIIAFALWVYFLKMRDRLEDRLAKLTAGQYYERDGLCFWPLIRVRPGVDGQPGQAEIALHYQNRFSGAAEAIVHLRPEHGAYSSHEGGVEVHMTFRAGSGAYGVIHQPIGIKAEHQGEPIRVEVAAAVRWPLGQGPRLRSHEGAAIGTFNVDWALAYRRSRHELCGEIELKDPVVLTMSLPDGVATKAAHVEASNETIEELDQLAKSRLP
ncbi:MAG: hypothetical protein AAGK04_09060 [Planctomycetota bacterium]